MRTLPFHLLRLASLLIGAQLLSAQDSREWVSVDNIDNKHLTYGTYTKRGEKQIDISDLIIPDESTAIAQVPVFRNVPDFKQELLRAGLAELKDYEKAPPELKEAQDQAKAARKGIWLARLGPIATTPADSRVVGEKPRLSAPTEPFPDLNGELTTIQNNLPVILTVLCAAISSPFLFSWYVERKHRRNPYLLVMGQASAGKTSVIKRLVRGDDVQEDEILSTKQSDKKLTSLRSFKIGPLTVHAKYVDIPGAEFGQMLDEMVSRRRHLFVMFVLSPTPRNACGSPALLYDEQFIATQLGIIQAQLGGLISSQKLKKPRGIILFINKFDLACEMAPTDPKATAHAKALRSQFASHLKSINDTAKLSKIPLTILLGSAVRNWNFDKVRSFIADPQ